MYATRLNHPYRQKPTENPNLVVFGTSGSDRNVDSDLNSDVSGSFKSEPQLTLEPPITKKQYLLNDRIHHQDIDKRNFSSRYVPPSAESNITPDAERPDGVRNRTTPGRSNLYVHPHFREGGRDSAVYRSTHEQWGSDDKLPPNFFWLREESHRVNNTAQTPPNLIDLITPSPPGNNPETLMDPFWEYDQMDAYKLATGTSSFVNSPPLSLAL
jgi:hypothetical protein